MRPQIGSGHLIWSLVIGYLLRESSFLAIESLARSSACRALGIGRRFSDDTLGYFTEKLDPEFTRGALITAIKQAKRNKAFDDCRFIGLALDGTTVGRVREAGCRWCRPHRNAEGEVTTYLHHVVMATIVGTGLTLPVDVEPYGSGDSEWAGGKRLLRRVVGQLGPRFADYVVVDGGYAAAPFLHLADELGLKTIVRLKANLPSLFNAAKSRFACRPPSRVFKDGADRVEIWDADDFDPWDRLNWSTVRVIRYRQEKPNGSVVEAYWLTNFSMNQVGAPTLFRMAKSRWEVENQGFNDAKNRYGMAHIPHHHANSLLLHWLLIILALTIERLYRLRHLHRGRHHPVPPSSSFVCFASLCLLQPQPTPAEPPRFPGLHAPA